MSCSGSNANSNNHNFNNSSQPKLNVIEFEVDIKYALNPTIAFGNGNTPTRDSSRGLMLGMSSGLLDQQIVDDDTG